MDLRPRQWNLLVLPDRYRNRLLTATAHLAVNGPLIVLDCGRQFDSSMVARAAHGRAEFIDQIKVQRAFICYEAVKLLEKTPVGKTPILVLGFLSTFYDENVKMHTRKFLLESSIKHFERLSQGAGLAVTIHPPSPHEDFYLFQRLRSSASQVLVYGTSMTKAQQMDLF
ncbi:MAG TPA: hypothetical protein DCX53_12245 [Anaerolineae bacterium]|nr:hypothetical protein [Anaerolineae bacterium]